LEETFEVRPKILTPPGNMYNEDTLISMKEIGLHNIQCDRNTTHQPNDEILLKYGILSPDFSGLFSCYTTLICIQ